MARNTLHFNCDTLSDTPSEEIAISEYLLGSEPLKLTSLNLWSNYSLRDLSGVHPDASKSSVGQKARLCLNAARFVCITNDEFTRNGSIPFIRVRHFVKWYNLYQILLPPSLGWGTYTKLCSIVLLPDRGSLGSRRSTTFDCNLVFNQNCNY